jgi:hypothetical protein
MKQCKIRPDLEADSDHVPVETTVRMEIPQIPQETRRKYKDMDVSKFRKYMQENLLEEATLNSRAEIDDRTAEIAEMITKATEYSTPKIRIHGTYTKEGYCVEVQEKILAARRRQWQRHMDEYSHNIYKKAMRDKHNAIHQANQNDHRERVSKVDSPDELWKLVKWVRNGDNPKSAFTPEIIYQGARLKEWEQKVGAFADTFFPTPPPADISDIPSYNYPPSIPCPEITEDEISHAIREAASDKASGPDQIPNRALKQAAEFVTEPLQALFNACIQQQYCPQHFKHSTTVVIPKLGKATYRETKSYRPIAHMNTIGKMLDSVIARRLQYYAEKFHLLPRNHTGGRKATSCEHALHLLVEKIHSAWNSGKVATLLLLDIAGAYDNVSHARLIHNLRKRHINPMLTGWLSSYLKDRTTGIRLKEGTPSPISTNTGIPQGSPLSPILYLFNNADLLDIGEPGDLVMGYIDDTSILAVGDTKASNVATLAMVHERAEEWAKRTGSTFAPQKYELIHFAKNKADAEVDPPLVLTSVTIQPRSKAKLLGMILDKHLTGIPHAEHVQAKAAMTIKGFQAIA